MDYLCDTCGDPATSFARDTYETTPVLSNGTWIGTHTVGELKSGCDLHPVYETDYPLSAEELKRLTAVILEVNYNSHDWTWSSKSSSTPDNTPENVCFCSDCGIENRGDPTEFTDLIYPHCDEVGDIT